MYSRYKRFFSYDLMDFFSIMFDALLHLHLGLLSDMIKFKLKNTDNRNLEITLGKLKYLEK